MEIEREREREKHQQNGLFMNRVGRVWFVSQCEASWWNITLEILCKPPPQPRCFYVSAKRETERAWHHYFTLIPVQSTTFTRSLFFRALAPVPFTMHTQNKLKSFWRNPHNPSSISCALLSFSHSQPRAVSVSPGQHLAIPLSGFPSVHGCHDNWTLYESSPSMDVLLAILRVFFIIIIFFKDCTSLVWCMCHLPKSGLMDQVGEYSCTSFVLAWFLLWSCS